MDKMTLHIINHTHWDREWFLSSIYTTHWIPRLIDRLVEISTDNPDFCYFLDGQTLIIEDLLESLMVFHQKRVHGTGSVYRFKNQRKRVRSFVNGK